jgi:hypothetical protein
MLSEKEVTAKFNANKKKIIKIMGVKNTTNLQLDRMGKQLFGTKYQGTFSQSYKPRSTPAHQCFIINTDLKGQPGTHWVAVIKNKNTYYIYDSFARTSRRLLPVFTRGRLIIDGDTSDAEQFGDSQICGQLCLSWIQVVKDHGIRNALLI